MERACVPPATRPSPAAGPAPARAMERHRPRLRLGRGACGASLLLHAACSLPPREPAPPPRPADHFVEARTAIDLVGNTYVVAIERDDRGERVVVAASNHYGETWGPLRAISGAPNGRRKSLSVATGAAGEIYVVWADTRHGAPEIDFNRSLDGGATWLPADRRINSNPPAGSHASFPVVRCDEHRDVYVVWLDDHEGFEGIYANRSRDRGETWLVAESRVTALSLGRKAPPRLACDQDGDAYVAWLELRDGIRSVYVNASTDHGETWLLRDVRLGGQAAIGPDLVALEGGVVVVAWLEASASGGHIFCARTLDRGRTWEAPRALGATRTGRPSPPRVLEGDRDQVYVAWQLSEGGEQSQILLASSRDAGARFGELVIAAARPGLGLVDLPADPAVVPFGAAADRLGNIYFGWLEPAVGTVRVGFDRAADFGRTGMHLQPTLDLEARPDLGLDPNRWSTWVPQLAADDFGHVCLLWNLGSDLEIAVSPFNGDSGWRPQRF